MNLLRFLKHSNSRKKNYLNAPSYDLREEEFLRERENFPTGLWRALRMFYEYMRGFYVFKNVRNCITVFGSARFTEHHPYYRMARLMGRRLAKNGFTVMTGGGPGIMEAANRGARDMGGPSISCNIQLPNFSLTEFPNRYVDRMIIMHYFFVRKVMLTKYSLAFIVMPGGFGTMDELFEIATLIQTCKLRHFPVILMGKEYWQPLMDFLQHTMLEDQTISQEDIDRLFVTDSPKEAMMYLRKHLKDFNPNPKKNY